ncbi:hypothetical protein BG910_10460 [Neisseria chenwenguii]|uniref:Uncharacterized protein n=1 Tax=Neisseria chenwenguii TaxID=1853278 RepID=A0A220S435_9NEIS|nr:hypothetical protein BG910_10460 [Neisseria chenwenguii]
MRLIAAGDLLFFASPKKSKQKKGDCGCRFGYAKLPSFHTIFRADKKLATSSLKQFCPFSPKNRVPLGCASSLGCIVAKVGVELTVLGFRLPLNM